MNLIPARYKDGGVEIAGHRLETTLKNGGERDVVVGIRPGAVRIGTDGIPATVELIEDLGDTAILDLELRRHVNSRARQRRRTSRARGRRYRSPPDHTIFICSTKRAAGGCDDRI